MNSEPATKQDLLDLDQRMDGRLASIEQRMDDKLSSLEGRMIEAMRDMETNLLRAFHGYAEANQKRMTALEQSDANIVSRLATMESRIWELERRVLGGHQAGNPS